MIVGKEERLDEFCCVSVEFEQIVFCNALQGKISFLDGVWLDVVPI